MDEVLGNDGDSNRYFRPTQGSTRIRIVGTGPKYPTHWVPSKNRNYAHVEAGCKACSIGERPKTKALIKVIDRSDGHVKAWEIGNQLMRQITDTQAMIKGEGKGDTLMDYDFMVQKRNAGGKVDYLLMRSEKVKGSPQEAADAKLVASEPLNLDEYRRKPLDEGEVAA
jgi:hypothetical protein